MSYELVIGLEVHAELNTNTKIFCGCENGFAGEENTRICPVCTGMPGTLPVLNQQVVESAIRAGLATNCSITRRSIEDRKNYNYPDLPKGYQISQRDYALCKNGYVDIEADGQTVRVGITQIHIEEDAGKLVHVPGAGYSRVDYNRSCVPLIEIVTEPDMRSAEQARVFLETLRNILLSIGVSDVKMQEGSLRCDVNVSLRKPGEAFGVRSEIKNMNSFRSVMRAIDAEYKRQSALLDAGETILQQTMRFDESTGKTYPMRTKEDSHDYRYFPDPDLLPIVVDDAWIAQLQATLPELPHEKKTRYISEYGIGEALAGMISANRGYAQLFEQAVECGAQPGETAKQITGDLIAFLRASEMEIEDLPFDGVQLAKLLQLVQDGSISTSACKQVLEAMVLKGGEPKDIVAQLGLEQVSDDAALLEVARQAIANAPAAVQDFKAGKEKAFTAIMGQAMKLTKGSANPQVMRELILKLLNEA
ncbi:Asp-tRNA(Asn)/Glu-tRNA(Gln) amidotransferase subunit GatB [Eubacteriales bacterium OttesenSCG-928-N14]|nr:Asp-tRNA(Asn)/Glu-tRNA(Gln) amidotransferase subunit GatB [Eubacteriales bacterium OttesenSCG-928-N14]